MKSKFWVLLSLIVASLGTTQATAGAAWRDWCETTAPLFNENLRPGRSACWVHDDPAGGAVEAATDSLAQNVELCMALTVKACFQPGVADQGATFFFRDASTEAKGNPSPYLADLNGGSPDNVASVGDCGDDGDDSGTELLDSKFYDFTPTDRFFWVDEVTAPGDGNTLFVNLVCR